MNPLENGHRVTSRRRRARPAPSNGAHKQAGVPPRLSLLESSLAMPVVLESDPEKRRRVLSRMFTPDHVKRIERELVRREPRAPLVLGDIERVLATSLSVVGGRKGRSPDVRFQELLRELLWPDVDDPIVQRGALASLERKWKTSTLRVIEQRILWTFEHDDDVDLHSRSVAHSDELTINTMRRHGADESHHFPYPASVPDRILEQFLLATAVVGVELDRDLQRPPRKVAAAQLEVRLPCWAPPSRRLPPRPANHAQLTGNGIGIDRDLEANLMPADRMNFPELGFSPVFTHVPPG